MLGKNFEYSLFCNDDSLLVSVGWVWCAMSWGFCDYGVGGDGVLLSEDDDGVKGQSGS